MDKYSTPKKMKKVSDLFSKYKNHFKPPQATIQKEASLAIKRVTNFDIKENQIKYTLSTKTLSLQIPSILKSELKLHYSDILEDLKTTLGEKESPKVIF